MLAEYAVGRCDGYNRRRILILWIEIRTIAFSATSTTAPTTNEQSKD